MRNNDLLTMDERRLKEIGTEDNISVKKLLFSIISLSKFCSRI